MKKLFIVSIVLSSLVIGFSSFSIQEKNAEFTNNSGKAIFEKNCASCHTGGFKGWMTGAPEIGEKEEWKPFFDKGASVMTTHIYEGTKKHEKYDKVCSKEQIKLAVEYIIAETK